MNEGDVKPYTEFILPPSVVSKIDLSRMVNEAERIDNALTASAVHEKIGNEGSEKPVFSEQFTSFLEINQLNFEDTAKRSNLITQLRLLKDKVPIVHMTFSVPADLESIQQIVKWVRDSTHPQAVILVGLQPALVAGVYLRTPNHILDLSLRAKLAASHDVLVKELEAVRGK